MFDQKQVGGLWIKKDKNGNEYLSGKINDKAVIVFKNKKKKDLKSPALIVYSKIDKSAERQQPDHNQTSLGF